MGSLRVNQSDNASKMTMLQVFASVEGDEEDIYPVIDSEIAQEQCADCELMAYFKKKDRSPE